MVSVNVDRSKVITHSKLQLGIQPDWTANQFVSVPTYGDYLRQANVKLIRTVDSHETGRPPYGNRGVSPCTAWNDSSKTGTFNWSVADSFASKCFSIGAQPLFCLGYSHHTEAGRLGSLPPGMSLKPTTGLPYSDSFAAYAREWVKHFKQTGQPVIYYELMNEPHAYFGWSPDTTKLGYFLELVNATTAAMRAENPNVQISFDFVIRKAVLDYWLANAGAELDSLNFHKYPAGIIDSADPGYVQDHKLFLKAEDSPFSSPSAYGRSIMDSQLLYQRQRGRLLPMVCSENNLNYHYATGTDPRIVRVAGAVYQTLFLRMCALNNVSYSVYYNMAGSKSTAEAKPLDGGGFGMFNLDNARPWAVYYTYSMIGKNLLVGNPIIQSTADSADVRSLAWINGNTFFLLLANLTHNSLVAQTNLSGSFETTRVDETMPYDNVSPINGLFPANAIPLQGYTVMLLKQSRSIYR